jgi:hypothetical protein
MWAGGDPRGPCMGKEYTEDPECYTSALEEACHAEDLDVLKRLKPDPKTLERARAVISAVNSAFGAPDINLSQLSMRSKPDNIYLFFFTALTRISYALFTS